MRTALWLEGFRRRDQLEGLGAGGRIILKTFFGKLGLRVWIGFTWLRIGTGCGCCEHGSELSFLQNAEDFLVAKRTISF